MNTSQPFSKTILLIIFSVISINVMSQTLVVPFSITQKTPLVISIELQSNVLCKGQANGSVSIKASGGQTPYTYNKDGIGGFGSNNTFAGLTAGAYTFTIKDVNNCTKSISINVTEPDALGAEIATKTDVSCFGGDDGTATVTPLGGTTPYKYKWPNGSDSVTCTDLSEGYYIVTVTDKNNCKTTTTANIIQPLLPLTAKISYSTPIAFCDGDSVGLTANTGYKFSYQWMYKNIVIPGATNYLYYAKAEGGYSVIVKNNNGCSDTSGAMPITVYPSPDANVTVTGNTTFCQGQSVDLSSNTGTGYIYQWIRNGSLIDGANVSSYVARQGGQYSVIITSTNGCSRQSAKEIISVNALPVADISTNLSNMCTGDTALLSTNYTASLNYQWFKNNKEITSQTDSAITVSTGGNYYLVVQDLNLCTKTSNIITINVQPIPNAIITTIGTPEFCAGNSVQLTTNTGYGYAYQWYKDNIEITDASNSTLLVKDSGSYTVYISDLNGCNALSAPVKTSILPNPDISVVLLGNTTMCAGDTVTLSVEDNINFNYNWKWNGIDQTKELSNSLIVTKAGQYSVFVANSQTGCYSQSAKTNVMVNQLPSPVINADGSLIVCINDSIKLATTLSYAGYNWSDGSTDAVISVKSENSYTVTVTDTKGCKGTDNISISESKQAAPEICMVSVSELQDYKNNIVTWNHKQGINIDHFNVYKMDQFSNVYQKIGQVTAAQDGIFSDLASTPAKRSEFYKISMVDQCNNETPLSVNHKTMHLMRVPGTDTTIINLIWENYEGMDFNSYTIFRGPDIQHMDTLEYVTNLITTYSDLQLPSYRPIYYNVGINLKDICVDGAKAKATERGPYTMSRSNVEDAGVIDNPNGDGIAEINGMNNTFNIYPNPVRDQLIINNEKLKINNKDQKVPVIILNALGQTVFNSSFFIINSSLIIDVSQFSNGMYYIRIDGVVKKFVVNK